MLILWNMKRFFVCAKYVKHSWCMSATNYILKKMSATIQCAKMLIMSSQHIFVKAIVFITFHASLELAFHATPLVLLWAPSKKRKFSVCSFYNALISHVNYPFLWKSIWHSKVPSRVAFSAWSIFLVRLAWIVSQRIMHLFGSWRWLALFLFLWQGTTPRQSP